MIVLDVPQQRGVLAGFLHNSTIIGGNLAGTSASAAVPVTVSNIASASSSSAGSFIPVTPVNMVGVNIAAPLPALPIAAVPVPVSAKTDSANNALVETVDKSFGMKSIMLNCLYQGGIEQKMKKRRF